MLKMSFLNPILLGCSALVACSALAFGEVAAPIGFWETQDDSGSKEHAIVEIYQQDSKLFGKIVQLGTPKTRTPFVTSAMMIRKISQSREW